MSSRPHIRFPAVLATTAAALLCSALRLGGQQATSCDPTQQQATLIETVQDRSTRVLIPNALVTATWRTDGDRQYRAKTDSTGKAIICASPDTPITLRVTYLDERTGTETTALTLSRTTRHTFVLDINNVLVRGTVLDQVTGVAVSNASVHLVNTPLRTLTSADGKFYFEQVPFGDYNLRVEHISYATVANPLTVRGEDLDASVRMTPDAIALQPIVVTAFSKRLDRVGFYERQKRGVGTFINRKQIDAMNVQSASDLLRSVPGMRLTPQIGGRRSNPRNETSGRGRCRPSFIVDGTRTLADFEMDFVAPYAIEGVEIYRGQAEIPAMFRSNVMRDGTIPTCGVIAIWTRDSR